MECQVKYLKILENFSRILIRTQLKNLPVFYSLAVNLEHTPCSVVSWWLNRHNFLAVL